MGGTRATARKWLIVRGVNPVECFADRVLALQHETARSESTTREHLGSFSEDVGRRVPGGSDLVATEGSSVGTLIRRQGGRGRLSELQPC